MKTFTVTYHQSCNYGALLQTYALQKVLTGLGHENAVFEYKNPKKYYLPLHLKHPASIPRNIYFNFLRWKKKKKLMALEKSFADFHKNHLTLSRVYDSMEDLRTSPPEADVYIAGSDQIWRFLKPEFIPARFLDFGDRNIKRISYAASLEKLNYTEEQKNVVRNYLSNFSAISLREESAAQYIAGITGTPTVRVIDPVFLLKKDEWESMAKKPRIDGPYIVCYQVQSNKRMQEVIDTLKKKTGYKTVSVNCSEIKWIKTDHTLYDVSPEEFLGLYLNAEIIVSASFHGSALGILFGKPTYGLIKNAGKNRIYEIFHLFHLDEYCISADSVIPDADIGAGRIAEIQAMIEKERENGLEYLRSNLNSGKRAF